MTRLLEDKNTIVYGGGGIAGGVARTFAREGARVFLAGRTREKLEAIASGIRDEGGSVEVGIVDVLDAQAVEDHAARVASEAGSIDATFLAVSRGDVQGTPLVDMSPEDVTRAPMNALLSTFHTSRAAARHMTNQASGAILTVTSATAAFPSPGMGSTGPADAAVESFLQTLAHEVGPQGVRVAVLWTAGVVETLTRESIAEAGVDVDPAQVIEMISGRSMLGRAPRLQQVADTAAFLASDRAAGITATVVNVTSGLVAR
jgi:NAD(P)-dependent dehydrogenase (short-subunit alcohol dehydrogenase family)